jgi:hypothetical protein
LRLLSPRFPLNDFYTAAKSGAEPALPAAADSWMAITRRDYIVRRYELNRSQFLLLNALQRGETIGDAIACAAESYLGEAEQFAVELQTWFKIWTAAPMFESVVIER